MRLLSLLLVLFTVWSLPGYSQGALLKNGGFEGGTGSDGRGGGVPEWNPFGSGYDVERQGQRHGEQCIRCDSVRPNLRRGAQTVLILNQKVPSPVLVTGWSKADAVSGSKDTDYSLYIDLEYTDGTPLWGQSAPFSTATHDWERRQVLILPQKPIKSMTLIALFRNHTGTAWFDDFYARELSGNNLFDSQVLTIPPPRPAPSKAALSIAAKDGLALDLDAQGGITAVRSGGQEISSTAAGGFFVRDVGADGPLVALRGTAQVRKAGGLSLGVASGDLQVRFNGKITQEGDTLSIDGDLTDVTKGDRALTVYFVLPVKAEGWQWGQDIRHVETIQSGREYSNQVRVSVGATGGLSLYPFGCVSNAQHGIGIASQMDWPSVYRIFYNGTTRQFVIAWDVAMSGKTATWPSHNARVRCNLFRVTPAQAGWGFRAATQRFYRLYPTAFERRTKVEGIWMPFTDPAKVQNPADFGFAFHEGDNSLKSDDALGILSFRYTEPTTFWMPMPPTLPRTYENAVRLLNELARQPSDTKNASSDSKVEMAKAVLNSGTMDVNEKFNLEFQNQPWANGAVFVLNPNPELPVTPEKPTRASIAYNFALASQMYGTGAKEKRGEQDGEYLDSLEGWADVQDYRPLHLQTCPYPIPFDTDTRRPVVPQWYQVHTFARFLSNDLHNRGKLLFANSTPIRFSIFAPLLDVMGIETNWLDSEGKWQPDSDATFNLRRTLSGQKPYHLLMNTDYERLTSPLVEKYFQRCLFYGVFPSMFSKDAATNLYWENPRWYNRDRELFKKYIPLIKSLSATGWQPLTHARSNNSAVWVERFGKYLTVFNGSDQAQVAVVTIDFRSMGLTSPPREVTNRITSTTTSLSGNSITLKLNAEEVSLLEIK